jgi:hypothetical protein
VGAFLGQLRETQSERARDEEEGVIVDVALEPAEDDGKLLLGTALKRREGGPFFAHPISFPRCERVCCKTNLPKFLGKVKGKITRNHHSILESVQSSML